MEHIYVTASFIHRFTHFSKQYLPRETFAVMIGCRSGSRIFITSFVHAVVIEATETRITPDWQDALEKAAQFYGIGFVHTHPSSTSETWPSVNRVDPDGTIVGDYGFFAFLGNEFKRRFNRDCYHMIVAPQRPIWTLYDSARGKPNEVLCEVTEEPF